MARRLACVWVCLVCSIAIHAVRAADHPLEPLSAAETKRAFEVVLARFRSDPALPHEPLRFPLVALLEPPKTFVLGWSPGQPFPRHAQLQVLHYPSDRLWIAEVDLEQKQLVRLDLQVLGTQAAISADEYRAIDVLVHDYEPWRRALRERNIDPALAYVDTWAPGDAPVAPDAAPRLSFGPNTRLARCLTFLRGTPTPSHMPQNPYARPIEGLLVTIDLNARKVLSLIDSGARAVSSETGNAHTKLDLKPLVVSEPRGSDIERKGRLVHWHHWQFYVALHPREGLVLYDVRFEDHGVLRPIAYRLSLSEIYVP
ncbi:MAG TPA: hypothetical protein VGI70_05990, partial [Polyangiales bacterium]